MNWEAVQAIAESIGAVGVIATLVYLAQQIRQNTSSLQAATVSRATELMSNTRRAFWSNPEVSDFVARVLNGQPFTDAVDGSRTRMLWIDLARNYESVFFQYQSGQLPESVWAAWAEEMRIVWCSPGGGAALEALRVDFLHREFVEFCESLRGPESMAALQEFRARWQQALVEVSRGPGEVASTRSSASSTT